MNEIVDAPIDLPTSPQIHAIWRCGGCGGGWSFVMSLRNDLDQHGQRISRGRHPCISSQEKSDFNRRLTTWKCIETTRVRLWVHIYKKSYKKPTILPTSHSPPASPSSRRYIHEPSTTTDNPRNTPNSLHSQTFLRLPTNEYVTTHNTNIFAQF